MAKPRRGGTTIPKLILRDLHHEKLVHILIFFPFCVQELYTF
jgi:hypothetical protein